MSGLRHLVVLTLDEQRFALPLEAVDRIVRAVEVTPLPTPPGAVLGVINVLGQVVPVVSLRRRCGLPEREINLDDQLVIAHTGSTTVALLVDCADVMECPAGSASSAEQVLPGLRDVREFMKREDGLILIYDPAALLSLEEERALADLLGEKA